MNPMITPVPFQSIPPHRRVQGTWVVAAGSLRVSLRKTFRNLPGRVGGHHQPVICSPSSWLSPSPWPIASIKSPTAPLTLPASPYPRSRQFVCHSESVREVRRIWVWGESKSHPGIPCRSFHSSLPSPARLSGAILFPNRRFNPLILRPSKDEPIPRANKCP